MKREITQNNKKQCKSIQNYIFVSFNIVDLVHKTPRNNFHKKNVL